MDSIYAGTATIEGILGADYHLMKTGSLSQNYITKKEAKTLGWTAIEGNLHIVAFGKQIGGDVFKNREEKLPTVSGRIWYEADINYVSGIRNPHRILYSNDGLIFVTYDHYETFFEITEKDTI